MTDLDHAKIAEMRTVAKYWKQRGDVGFASLLEVAANRIESLLNELDDLRRAYSAAMKDIGEKEKTRGGPLYQLECEAKIDVFQKEIWRLERELKASQASNTYNADTFKRIREEKKILQERLENYIEFYAKAVEALPKARAKANELNRHLSDKQVAYDDLSKERDGAIKECLVLKEQIAILNKRLEGMCAVGIGDSVRIYDLEKALEKIKAIVANTGEYGPPVCDNRMRRNRNE